MGLLSIRTKQPLFARIGSEFATFRGDRGGAVLVIFALLLPLLIGFIGLGVETAYWYAARRDLQAAADAAAMGAALEVLANSDATAGYLEDVAEKEMERNGVTIGGPVSVTINHPPTSGTYSGDSDAVEVSLSTSVNAMFSKLFIGNDVGINARAVARKGGSSSGKGCVLALNDSASKALWGSGAMSVSATTCEWIANSTADNAFRLDGAVSMNIYCARTAGGYSSSGAIVLNTTGCDGVQTNSATYADPYSNVNVSSYSTSCDTAHTNYTLSGATTTTINPGTYCGGIKMSGATSLTLTAGTYYLHNGSLDISGATTLKSSGAVTIILTGSSAGSVGQVKITGASSIKLTAPTSGTYKGILIMRDRIGSSGTSYLTGASSLNITGAVYTPTSALQFSGGTGYSSNCVQVVADTIKLVGATGMSATNCDTAGVTLAGPSRVQLVE